MQHILYIKSDLISLPIKAINPDLEKVNLVYRKVASSKTYRLEAHAGFFRLLMKGIFDPYVL